MQLNLKKLEDENKLLKNKLKDETNKKNDKLQITLKKIEDENKLLKNQLKDEINKNKELNSELIKIIMKKKNKRMKVYLWMRMKRNIKKWTEKEMLKQRRKIKKKLKKYEKKKIKII